MQATGSDRSGDGGSGSGSGSGPRLTCVDVFSGTGGISLGLRDFATTLQYCEVNEFCQSVLVDRMREGRLDRAPIHGDIRSLCLSPLSAPVMIAGGSPCTDISTIGLRKGIVDGPQSSLFFQVMRLVDECPSVRVLFLENVPNITKVGMADVVAALTARGFDMFWTQRSAGSMGAPHARNRWFCLGVRGEPAALRAVDASAAASPPWAAEPEARVTFRPAPGDAEPPPGFDANWAQRCRCLGNAVVPGVVRACFLELVRLWQRWPALKEALADFSSPMADLSYPYPPAGAIIGGDFFAVPLKHQAPPRHAVDIRVQGRTLENYPTPRHGIAYASSVTERSLHDLPTVLINTDVAVAQAARRLGAAPERMHQAVLPSVEYVEWMMGYPAGWTRTTFVPSSCRGTRGLAAAESDAAWGKADDGGGGGGGGDGGAREPRREPRPFKPNGMHMFMRDHPGRGFQQIAALWNPLPADEKAAYSRRAAEAFEAARAL